MYTVQVIIFCGGDPDCLWHKTQPAHKTTHTNSLNQSFCQQRQTGDLPGYLWPSWSAQSVWCWSPVTWAGILLSTALNRKQTAWLASWKGNNLKTEWCRTLHTPETKCKQETAARAKSPQDMMGDCWCCSRGTRTVEPWRMASTPYFKLTCLARLRSEAWLRGPFTKLHILAWWWTCCCLDFNHWMGLRVL